MSALLSIGSGSDSISAIFSSFFSFAKKAFLEFSPKDAVDIILLTVVFFCCFRFLKQKQAGMVILGIIVCVVVFILSLIFELSGINYILSGVFQIGILALVIIFHPEIRELLEKVGSGSIKGIRALGSESKNKEKTQQIINNITKAVHILSMEKTGALIVLSGTTKIDNVIHSGIPVNADISDSLLRNIFYNKAPLHDGAVVIDSGKITAASCILPLPKRVVVDNDLGTRHRAAIGLSEVSDAIIIVVSEETGIISIARECELTRGFTAESLRKYLVKEILKEDKEGETIN